MGIDWEEILGAEGDQIQAAFDEAVAKAEGNYKNNYSYEYYRNPMEIEENNKREYFLEILQTLKVTNEKLDFVKNIDISEMKWYTKARLIEQIWKKTDEYEYILDYYEGKAIHYSIVELYCTQTNYVFFDFWKMIREKIYNNWIPDELDHESLDSAFETLYTNINQSVEEYSKVKNDFFNKHHMNMRNINVADYISYINKYMDSKVTEDYIVAVFCLHILALD